MTTHDKPSDRVDSVVGNLEMWALSLEHDMGAKAARYDLEDAIALIRDQQAEIERLTAVIAWDAEKLCQTTASIVECDSLIDTLRTRAEQAEAQLAAMRGRLG